MIKRIYHIRAPVLQLLLLRSAFFFLLREIYSVRMSTSEFGSIILLNKESLHLISFDPSESTKLFDVNPKKQN